MQQPGDGDYEAALAAVPEAAWREVEASLAVLPASIAGNAWGGGQESRPGVVQMPFMVYSDGVELLLDQLGRAGVLLPFNWAHWHGRDTYAEVEALRRAPVADAVRFVVAVIRSDRFVEGALDAQLRRGSIGAALENMSAWRREHAAGAG
ncbi:DUF6508 domain-containing protein [Kineococcus sp. SYSU DK006]|uniref:DUF6508 domain-containing protein n=1 Tax=Kineococcus sp. SYSU DK006 TaxID=3383127 RepID=UPI003D7DE6A1